MYLVTFAVTGRHSLVLCVLGVKPQAVGSCRVDFVHFFFFLFFIGLLIHTLSVFSTFKFTHHDPFFLTLFAVGRYIMCHRCVVNSNNVYSTPYGKEGRG